MIFDALKMIQPVRDICIAAGIALLTWRKIGLHTACPAAVLPPGFRWQAKGKLFPAGCRVNQCAYSLA